ncbi:MAG TPA: hypothetical protein VM529_26465 [Gemmata sp.]|nr:hypothetical protein [Gemmata sp.]
MSRLALFALFLFTPAAVAQQPGAANREAMKKLDYLVGKWKGDATVTQGPKGAMKLTQTEDVQYGLDGVIMHIEGIGRGKRPGKEAEPILFHAFAVVSYDVQAKKYKVKAYRVEGTSVDADLTLTEKGFVWGFKEPTRGVEVKYTLTITPKGEWHEVGEYSQDGKTWTQFIEMTLTRVKE